MGNKREGVSSLTTYETTPFLVNQKLVQVNGRQYPVTHRFVVKSNPMFPIVEYFNQFPPFNPNPWDPSLPEVEISYTTNFPSRALRGWRFQSVMWSEWWSFRWLRSFTVVLWQANVGWYPHMGTTTQDLIAEFKPPGYWLWDSLSESFDVPSLPQPMDTDYDLDELWLPYGVFADPPYVGQLFPPWGAARPWSEFEAFRHPDPPNVGAVIGLVSEVNMVWMHDWANHPPLNPPVFPPHDYVCWVRGTKDSEEWNESVSGMHINDNLFSPGQTHTQPRRLSDQWFWEPWKRYPHLP